MGACVSSNFCRIRRKNFNNNQQQLQNLSAFENSYNTISQNEQIVITNNDLNQTINAMNTENHSQNTIPFNYNQKRNVQINDLLHIETQSSNSRINNINILNQINSFSSNSCFNPPTGNNKRLKKDKYKNFTSERKISEAHLEAKREEFWHTAPHFEGKVEIWSALRATIDAYEKKNFILAQAIIDSANIILPNGLLNDCYDELGNRYQIPIYVLARPVNLVRRSKLHAVDLSFL